MSLAWSMMSHSDSLCVTPLPPCLTVHAPSPPLRTIFFFSRVTSLILGDLGVRLPFVWWLLVALASCRTRPTTPVDTRLPPPRVRGSTPPSSRGHRSVPRPNEISLRMSCRPRLWCIFPLHDTHTGKSEPAYARGHPLTVYVLVSPHGRSLCSHACVLGSCPCVVEHERSARRRSQRHLYPKHA